MLGALADNVNQHLDDRVTDAIRTSVLSLVVLQYALPRRRGNLAQIAICVPPGHLPGLLYEGLENKRARQVQESEVTISSTNEIPA